MKNKEYFAILVNMAGYIHCLAQRFSTNSHPYSKEDYEQEAKLALWKTYEAMPELTKPDSFWKKVIRNSMLDFFRTNVKKVNRAQTSFRDQVERYKGTDWVWEESNYG
jgi:DNA-directed RNA polymerase specialized sigma24 family protein